MAALEIYIYKTINIAASIILKNVFFFFATQTKNQYILFILVIKLFNVDCSFCSEGNIWIHCGV